jgi:hypothetical protein
MFEMLEVQRLLESQVRITLVPPGSTNSLFGAQLAAQSTKG